MVLRGTIRVGGTMLCKWRLMIEIVVILVDVTNPCNMGLIVVGSTNRVGSAMSLDVVDCSSGCSGG